MELKDFQIDMFDEGVPSIVLGNPYVEKMQMLKPIERGLGKITNQTIFLNENQGYINKAIIGGVDDKGQNFIKEFVYVGDKSTLTTSSAKKEMPKDEFEKFRQYIDRKSVV